MNKILIFVTRAGWYAVMVWDDYRNCYSLWWSGSKKRADALAVAGELARRTGFTIEEGVA